MEKRSNFARKFIIKQNIERVWAFVRDPKMFIFYNKDPYYKCEILEGRFLWEKGSKFITLRKSNQEPYKTLNYTFTCLNSESGPDYKFILFAVTLQNVLTFYKKVNLFNVTSDNSTVMTYEFYDFSNQSNEYIALLKEQTSYDVSKLDEFLQTSTIGFLQNESTVITLPIESLWNRVLSHDLIKELFKGYFSPLQHINKEEKIDNNTSEELYRTVGEIFKILYAIYVEVKEVSNVKNEIKREVLLSIYNNNICITKEIRLTFIQIDEGKSYFSMCHYFTAPDSPDSIKQLR